MSTDTAGRGSDFAELSRRVAGAGLLGRRAGYYAMRIGTVATLYAAGWVLFAAAGDSWLQLGVAAFLAVVFAQVALVAHDIAHRQVFGTRRASEIAGRVAGNLGIGMSYGWWMGKHSRHHANPNDERRDPDVAPETLVWSTEQASATRGWHRALVRTQAYLFFPLLTLLGVNLHVSSVRALPRLRSRRLEAALLLGHAVGYLGAVLAVLSPVKALVFIAVHQGLFGIYLGAAFAPNHKGMPAPTDGLDFLRRQVLTSRNVRSGWLVDVALGGLGHQIEHHLFASMPTPNLRRARPIVRAYCAEHGVPYTETGLIDSYVQALRHLHRVGAALRTGNS